ncbi:hypothetical protein QYE76_013788 [Lolium multiflorum]|uniref:Probable threonine--tRNA ligase, cytoplasmic n=1 Tax=Lolium multiflorum TaxID=4521 RepID=A0AAD8U1D9_LOLMU|nr:hypothetical protein QYE76_013788 [Lolium multiflorum]
MGGKEKAQVRPPAVVPDEAYLALKQNRIRLFEQFKDRQARERIAIGGDPIRITLPDHNGTVKEGKKWMSTPMDIAKEILSSKLAASCLIAQVNGEPWDMTRPLEDNCELKLLDFDTVEGRATFWRSSALILGEALESLYGCNLCSLSPCTTSAEGFYCDAYYNDITLNESDFGRIQDKARKAVAAKQPFERIVVSRAEALECFAENKFKFEIISELPDKAITLYRCGSLVDLCPGPHIPNTSFVKAFACLKASSSYWRGKANRESLQRVHGISFPDSERLKEYEARIEAAEERNHRILGESQKLFFFNPLSPGSPNFLPHGIKIKNKLFSFLRQEYRDRGYQEVESPNVYNMEIWEKSGHAMNYKENMFTFEIDKREFGLKPMNCPGHCIIFKHGTHSYRELPLRIAEFGVLHRNEASGALTGLTRVRRFQQDDAHIFCRESQIKDEVKSVLEFIKYVYDKFGFNHDYELELSTRPEKYLGDIETWNKAEQQLREALLEFGKPFEINEGDGAFYGPKIDVGVFDALKRKHQCATIQLDFQLPICFDLTYSTEEGTEKPVMIHRAILGSFERMFAILLEHYNGKWPLWLSPRQAIVCSISPKSVEYAKQVHAKIYKAGFDVDMDTSDKKIDKKVAEAQAQGAQFNYILVVGEREAKSETVSVRLRGSREPERPPVSIDNVIARLRDEVAAYR